MKQKRLIPFSTLFIADDLSQHSGDEYDLAKQIKQWVKSSSFNANGVVYLLVNDKDHDEDEGEWMFSTFRLQRGVIKTTNETVEPSGFFTLCKKVHQLNVSLTVAIGYSAITKILTICSGSNYKIGPKSISGFFLYKRSFPMRSGSFMLSEDIPELFNNAALKSVGYAQTRFIDNFEQYAAEQIEQHRAKRLPKHKKNTQGDEQVHADMHTESVDLGVLQNEVNQYLIWVPNAKKSKTSFREFAEITFIAETLNVSITAFFRDEKLLKKFSKDFYIKGRKKDFDKYLTVEIGDRDLFERLSLGSHISIFSSSLDSLYRRERKRAGKEKIVTLYSYKKKNQ